MIKDFAVRTEFAIASIARIALRVVILFLRVRIFVLFTGFECCGSLSFAAAHNVAVVGVVGA